MPTWGEILIELQEALKSPSAVPPFDAVRRKYLALLHQKTGRNTILYATNWTQPGFPVSDPNALMIGEGDIEGLMEVIHGLNGADLDLVLHSPGGSAESTEALVTYLRTKFSDIRVIIPQAAMSAATMLACASNRIVMGKHSFIGPIDPQVRLLTQAGPQMAPAQSIVDQFERGKKECVENPKNLGPWLPMLGQYGPALLVQCEEAQALAKELVSEWLARYMFSGKADALDRASKIAHALSDHQSFKTHGRHIGREKAKELGLVIEDLESDQELQDAVLSVFHATSHTFGSTTALKIIENHLGKAYLRTQPVPQMIQLPPGIQIVKKQGPPQQPEQPSPPNSPKA